MNSAQVSSCSTTNTVNGAETPTLDDRSNIRVTKRKLDDAFQVLDDAVGSTESIERPSPSKKSHSIRSLYTTLAKYGIKSKSSKQSGTSTPSAPTGKSTPHLTAILNRAASRTRKAFPFNFPGSATTPIPALPPTAEYRPSSIPAFLSRLATYKLATYANKPPALDAVAASKCGWINDGKDRLVCGLCNSSWVVAGKGGMSRDAANSLIEKQRASLVNMHKDGCPWKARQCDASIYRIPLQTPATMVRDIKLNALALTSLLDGVEVKHPLTANQLNSLRSTISSFALPSSQKEPKDSAQEDDVFVQSAPPEMPLDSAILISLFGWAIVPPAAPEPRRPSLSRASSVASSAPLSRASTPPLSRASSVAHQRPPSGAFSFRMPSNLVPRRDASLLQCSLCQRRVGIWAFVPPPVTTARVPEVQASNDNDTTMADPPAPLSPPKLISPQRQFDLLKEHRSYCPYVVRSTLVPTLPTPPPPVTPRSPTASSTSLWSSSSISQANGQSALEGWRAVLTVVLRYGMGQRQRIGLDFVDREAGGEGEDGGDPMEVDEVKAMVAGVKSRGGKDLLKYVKGLLG